MENLTSLGVGGIFAILVLKQVFEFVGTKRNGKVPTHCEACSRVLSMTRDLHKWHQPDSDGEQSWKNKHMGKVVANLEAAVKDHTRVMERKLIPILERLEQKI